MTTVTESLLNNKVDADLLAPQTPPTGDGQQQSPQNKDDIEPPESNQSAASSPADNHVESRLAVEFAGQNGSYYTRQFATLGDAANYAFTFNWAYLDIKASWDSPDDFLNTEPDLWSVGLSFAIDKP